MMPQIHPDQMPRVLHVPTAIGGNPQGLALAERELGLRSTSVILKDSPFRYQADRVLLKSGEPEFLLEMRRWGLLWDALRNYDIVHFNFGRPITPVPIFGTSPSLRRMPHFTQRLYNIYARLFALREIPLLKRMGKAIFVTFQGDDLRQGDYCRKHFAISPAHGEVEDWYYSDSSDAFKRWMVDQYARWADGIYALNPDLLYVLPERAQFMAYASVDPRRWQPIPLDPNKKRLTVLHAPSHRGFKGTRFVIDAVERLQREDKLDFEFVLVENMSHADAVKVYQRADLLVDQLLAGWYGALAVELMALSKPVICYIRQEDLKFIPPGMKADLPLINATPDSIYSVLRLLLTERRHMLSEIGERGRAYVERWHDPRTIATDLRTAYQQALVSTRH